MNNDLLILIKKHTDTLIEQTKTKPQETLEYEKSERMESFSFNPPINLVEEGKRLLAATSFEATNSVFNIIDENNSLSITIPGHWETKSAGKIIDELNNLLELRSENGIELHVKEVRKRAQQSKREDNEYKLSVFGTQKKSGYLKN